MWIIFQHCYHRCLSKASPCFLIRENTTTNTFNALDLSFFHSCDAVPTSVFGRCKSVLDFELHVSFAVCGHSPTKPLTWLSRGVGKDTNPRFFCWSESFILKLWSVSMMDNGGTWLGQDSSGCLWFELGRICWRSWRRGWGRWMFGWWGEQLH